MLNRLAPAKFLLTLASAGLLLGASPARAQTTTGSLPLLDRKLVGMKVEDLDGQKIGTVRNLAIDLNSGKVKYAVIGSGGIFGVHATLKLAPSQVMSAATTKRHTLSINTTAARWKNAPVFKLSSLTSLNQPDRASEISRYFQVPEANSAIARTNSLTLTGRETNPQSTSPELKLKLSSELIGMRVVNAKQEKIGEILDLLVSFGESKPAFAIISTGRLFHQSDQYAVPLTVLSWSNAENKFTLDADTSALQQAPSFDQSVWEAGGTNGSSRIFRYTSPGE